MPFQSTSQQRFAFGTHQPWARRWAKQTNFKRLPYKKRTKAFTIQQLESFVSSEHYDPDTAGAIAAGVPELASFKAAPIPAPATAKPAPGAKGESLGPGITRIHGNLCNVHGRYGPCDKALSGKKPKGGRGRNPRVAKPKGDRAAEHAKNRSATLTSQGYSADDQAALGALRDGAQPAKVSSSLLDKGLVEQASDGSYRMTSSGRALMSAADQGDSGRAHDTASGAAERVSARNARRNAAAVRQQEAATRHAQTTANREQAKRQRADAQAKRALAHEQKKPSGGSKQPSDKNPTNAPKAPRASGQRTPRARTARVPPSASRASSALSKPKPAAPKAPAKQIAPALTEAAQSLSDGKELSDADTQALIRNGLARLVKGELVLTAAGQRQTMKQAPAHTGVMVALYPDPVAAKAIAAQKGVTEPIDRLHLTLAFLGDSTETALSTNKDKLIEAIKQWAAEKGRPLEGTMNGVGRFFHSEDDDTNAVYVSPDVPGLPELRQSLVAWIEQSGFDYAQNHGFTPHITVAYVPLDAPTPPIRAETPIRFPQVTLAWGDERYDYPLGTKVATKAAGSPGDYLIALDPQKSSTWHLQVKRGGKPDHGLMGSAWAALHSGFRGNVYQGPQKGAALAKLKKLYQSEGVDIPKTKDFLISPIAEDAAPSFRVFKDASGRYRWVAQSSTAYQDRDREIVSTKALADDCAFADSTGHYGPLRWWHAPGLDLGDCDFNAMHGKVLIESGTFRSPTIAQKVASASDSLEISLGFLHLPTEPDASGVFHHIRKFERSLVPRGKASNRFTAFRVKERPMFDPTKVAALKTLGFSDADITNLQTQAEATEKAADAQQIAYKSEEAGATEHPDLEINGIVYKAFPPKPAASAAPVEGSPEEEAAESPEEEAAEPDAPMDDGGGLTLSPEDMQAIGDAVAQALSQALGPLVSTMDLTNKIGSHMDELKGMMGGYTAKKDATDAERAEQIAQLQTSLKAAQEQIAPLQAKLDDLLGLQPAVSPRASAAPASMLNPFNPADNALLQSVKDQAPPEMQAQYSNGFEDLKIKLFGS
jgi:2'-5' RNA ligase